MRGVQEEVRQSIPAGHAGKASGTTLKADARGLGLATATTSVAFFPHCEQRIRCASCLSVILQPTSRASASGSMCREAPHTQLTRTRNCPKQSSSFLM